MYKHHPFRGFIPANSEDDEGLPDDFVDDLEYKHVPYIGFVPVTEEEMAEEPEVDAAEPEKRYKFHPYYGFVEKKGDEAMEEEPKEEQLVSCIRVLSVRGRL